MHLRSISIAHSYHYFWKIMYCAVDSVVSCILSSWLNFLMYDLCRALALHHLQWHGPDLLECLFH